MDLATWPDSLDVLDTRALQYRGDLPFEIASEQRREHLTMEASSPFSDLSEESLEQKQSEWITVERKRKKTNNDNRHSVWDEIDLFLAEEADDDDERALLESFDVTVHPSPREVEEDSGCACVDPKFSTRAKYIRSKACNGARFNVKEAKKKRFLQKIHPHGVEDDFGGYHSGPCKMCGVNGCVLHITDPELMGEPDDESNESQTNITECDQFGDAIDDFYPDRPNYQNLPDEQDQPSVSTTRPLHEELIDTAGSVNLPPPSETSELEDLLRTLQPTGIEVSEDLSEWMSYLENIVILGYQVGRASSYTDIFVAVMAYIKMHTQRSVIREVLQHIDSLTKDMPTDVEPQAWETRDVLEKWELFKSNTIFTKISYLITAAMSLTVCSVKSIEWSPMGMELVSLYAAETQLKAIDAIDALVHTFTWLCESGYAVFQEKSLMPLLYSDNAMRTFNTECDYVLAHAEAVLAGNGGDVQDFESKLDAVMKRVSSLKETRNSGPTAVWLQTRYSKLVEIKFRIIAKHKNTAIRFAPFGIGLTGSSGVGKSTLAKIVMHTALCAMGFEADTSRIITRDMFDKYDSTYTSDILGMFLDDVGNGKAEFQERSPSDVIIKFFNNMAAQAVKAELTGKGVVFIGFKVGVMTSNFPDYSIPLYTHKPEACLRRFIHLRVRVKECYRLPGGVSLDTNHPDLVDCELCKDIWELDLEECHIYEMKAGTDAYKFRTIETTLLNGKKIKCKNLDLPQALDAIIVLAKRHAANQEKVITRSRGFDTMKMCKTCFRPEPLCACKIEPHGLEAIGDVLVDSVKRSVLNYVNGFLSPVNFFNSLLGFRPIKAMTTRQLTAEMTHVINETVTPYAVSLTPEWLFQTKTFQRSIELWQHSAAMCDLKGYFKWIALFGGGSFAYGAARSNKLQMGASSVFTWLASMTLWSQYRARIRILKKEYDERRDALPVLAKEVRDGYAVKGAFLASTMVVGLKIFQMWNRSRVEKVIAETEPDSLSKEELEESPGWFGSMMERIGLKVETTEASASAHPSHLLKTLQKSNLFWAEFKRSDGSETRCNIFFPRKSVAWFPMHIFHPNSDMGKDPVSLVEVTVYRHDQPGGKFTFKCEKEFCSSLPHLDLACAFVPNCPDLRDKLKWLPLTKPTGKSVSSFVVRTGRSDIATERVTATMGEMGHKYLEFYGGHYMSKHAKVGSCMGAIVLEQKSPIIQGFHIGGKPTTNYGVFQTITKNDADMLLEELEKKPGVCLSALATDLPATQYGRTLIERSEIHPMSMPAQLCQDAFVDLLGSTKLRTVQRSSVVQSILSDAVKTHLGVPNTWGPPKLVPNWKGYNATLEHVVNPADMFVPSKLERARQDWLAPLIPLMEEYVKTEDFRPLTLKEMIMGIDGKRFIDALKVATSMGFPVFGPKSKYFVDVLDENGVVLDRVPSPQLKVEMDRIWECWLKGERAYPVTSATLKDETTPVDSDKVRVFQAVACAFGMYIRAYFLPVARFLSLHPLESESAVGVNAFSQEWSEMMDHANKYADDNQVIAWDYSKYDVRMNSQMTRAVLLSMIDLAKAGGYDEESLKIMKTMIVDIAHPLIDWNGTLMMCYNMNTSGNNITVVINGIAGSFYVRMGFFDAYPLAENFRDNVSALTYGDDFRGSVSKPFRKFNFHYFKEYMAKHKIKVTLPDKSSDAVAFMNDEDADFLKRQSNFIPEINTSIGRLDEKSILKSLHCNVKSKKQFPEMIAVSCIETAMHEWFAHGRQHYEMRAEQMKKVCEDCDLPVPAVTTTFDERVEDWLCKYT